LQNIDELIASASGIPSVGPQRQQLIQRFEEHFIDVDDDELRSLLPRDEADRETSIGALLHESRRCAPCRIIRAGKTCIFGLKCGFCHFPHDPVPVDTVTGDQWSGKRPCRTERDMYRRQLERIDAHIRADPWNFAPAAVQMPSDSFDGRQDLKNKFMAAIVIMAESARAEAAAAAGRTAHANSSSSSAAVGRHVGAFASSHNVLPVRGKGRQIVHL